MAPARWKVLRYALSLSKAAQRLGDSNRVILVSKDMVVRVRANALQLEVRHGSGPLDGCNCLRTAQLAVWQCS